MKSNFAVRCAYPCDYLGPPNPSLVSTYKPRRRVVAPKLDLQGLYKLSNFTFTGDISALQFVQRTLDAYTTKVFTQIHLWAGYRPGVPLLRRLGTLRVLDEIDRCVVKHVDHTKLAGMRVTVLQHICAVGPEVRADFDERTFFCARHLFHKKFMFNFEVW